MVGFSPFLQEPPISAAAAEGGKAGDNVDKTMVIEKSRVVLHLNICNRLSGARPFYDEGHFLDLHIAQRYLTAYTEE